MSKVRMTTNLETLGKDIGHYLGLADGIGQKEYMNSLIKSAHGKTVPDFVAAVASAASNPENNLTHMYEFGVAGITRGDKQFINPLLPSARLWTNHIVGRGGQQKLTFMFRPATRRVPRHTTESTGGVDQEVLDRLKLNRGKRYVFQHKAEVYEQGVDVNIFPRKAKGFIFVPNQDDPNTNYTAKQDAAGYTWRKAFHTNPGLMSDSVGMFQAFFFNWWETEGGTLMGESMAKQVDSDIIKTEAIIAAERGTMKPTSSTNIIGASAKAQASTRKQWTIWAQREQEIWEKVL